MREKNGKNIDCIICGKQFYRCLSHINPNTNYCSRACHYGTVIKNCEVCGNNIKARKGNSERKRFCSRKCLGVEAAKHKNFIPNKNPWNKGIKTGHTPWNKGIEFHQVRGSNNVNWKGGITPINRQIRTSLEYKNWRSRVFERDGYTCVWCGIKGGWSKEKKNKVVLNADHILPFATHPKLRLDINNGRTLCVNCHKKTDTHGINFIRWDINPKQNLSITYTQD